MKFTGFYMNGWLVGCSKLIPDWNCLWNIAWTWTAPAALPPCMLSSSNREDNLAALNHCSCIHQNCISCRLIWSFLTVGLLRKNSQKKVAFRVHWSTPVWFFLRGNGMVMVGRSDGKLYRVFGPDAGRIQPARAWEFHWLIAKKSNNYGDFNDDCDRIQHHHI